LKFLFGGDVAELIFSGFQDNLKGLELHLLHLTPEGNIL
jgi:hypothetical protein